MVFDYAFSDPNAENHKNMPRKREFKVNEKLSLFAECRDPFGFWYVTASVGKVSDQLSGAFTSYDYARDAITGYIDNFLKDRKKEV